MKYAQTLVSRCGRTAVAIVVAFAASQATLAHADAFLDHFDTVKLVASTVPANQDVNPYGVAVVRRSVGMLEHGNILVSNFNNGANLQGTGTTIVQITPEGATKLFAQIDDRALGTSCPGGVGLTTALVVLRRGWVIVGSLPTTDGTSATAQPGCLIVLNANGEVVETFHGGDINGPWDMTASDREHDALLFVTNVLNGDVTQGSPHVVDQGTVVRLALEVPKMGSGMPTLQSSTVIGSDFSETADPDALIVGPTGVGLAHDETLYVADSVNSRIRAIPDAVTRLTTAHTGSEVTNGGALNTPLGLAIAPNGDILTANGGDGNLVETTPGGSQVAIKTVEAATGAGSLFGIALIGGGRGVYFVDDGDNTLKALVGDKNDQETDQNDED